MLALVPAAAAAQSAGDEQYEDPFGDEQPQAQATPAPAQAPAAQAPTTPAPATPATPTQPATSPSAQAELPRTGGDARLPALLGLALLSAGVALRAHARRVT
jgi:uncharacterized surface anchored protein